MILCLQEQRIGAVSPPSPLGNGAASVASMQKRCYPRPFGFLVLACASHFEVAGGGDVVLDLKLDNDFGR